MSKNILVIDDNKEILDIIRQILILNDFNVFSFDYFKIALKFYQLRHQEISLVLLDMQLNDAIYSETIPALNNINPNIPIIGMSGGLNIDHLEPLYQQSLFSFLQKPFGSKNLLSEVFSCLASTKR